MDILFSRTGVTILSDILRYCADHNIDIDIPKVKFCFFSSISQILSLNPQVLSHLRQQRMLMVQTVAQVGKIILLFLSQPRFCFSTSSCTPRSSTTSARAGSSSWCQIRWSDSDQISSKVSSSDDIRSVLRQ